MWISRANTLKAELDLVFTELIMSVGRGIGSSKGSGVASRFPRGSWR